MCRMLGVVSAQSRSFDDLLRNSPRSMAALSNAHPDGWGIAIGQKGQGWTLRRSILRAFDDRTFHDLASQSMGDLMVAHVRQKTRGEVAMQNTHPFESPPWVFAHTGTIDAIEYLEERTSAERRKRIEGATDSERLFAYLMTRIDENVRPRDASRDRIDRALRAATSEFATLPRFGTASFLLSDGYCLCAYRLRASLYVLPSESRDVGGNAEYSGEPSIAVTTEPLTDEAWTPLQDGELIRVDRDLLPNWTRL